MPEVDELDKFDAEAVEPHADEELWQEAEDLSGDRGLARYYSDKAEPKCERRQFSAKAAARAALKALAFALAGVVAAILVWSLIYMLGSHTPVADMPAALGRFFARLFA